MHVLDARRLTGLNVDIDGPGVMAEVDFGDPVTRGRAFADFAARLALFLPDARPVMRPWAEGGKASVSFEAPIDRLYAVVGLVEAIFAHTADDPDWDRDPAVVASIRADFDNSVAVESVPSLLAIQAEAARVGVPFLWDDDFVSLGYGSTTRSFAARALPTLAELGDLTTGGYRDMPKVFITGTNGKTTTSRMTARILKMAGFVVGASSTDALTVDEVIIDRGDWTGPGAARRILRHPEVTAAVLETARGGMLRRGLGVVGVDAAAVTNVGADHFGDHGIVDLAGMARTKATVWRAVRPGGKRIVNAGCDASFAAALNLVRLESGDPEAERLPPETWVLTSLAPANPRIEAHRAAGGEVWFIEDETICRAVGPAQDAIMRVSDIPAAWGGTARHNIANALVAGALAFAIGLTAFDVATGLATFGASVDDNPGRAERWHLGESTIVLDFGHNAHGLIALAPMVAGLVPDGARLAVSVGQAGDRSDKDLADLVDGVMAFGPSFVTVRALPGYERGREAGEVEELIESAFLARGLGHDAVIRAESEVAALETELAWARPGDVILHLVHVERASVRDWLLARGAVAR